MNLYSIYIDNKTQDNSPTIIKQGFSFSALIFNFFWALYHRMWLIAGLLLIINLIISYFDPSSIIIFAEQMAQFFIFGFFASEIREFYAKKQGLELEDIILASSEEEAEVKYIARTLS